MVCVAAILHCSCIAADMSNIIYIYTASFMYVATLHSYMETNSTTSHTNIYTDYHSRTNLTKYRKKSLSKINTH